MFGSPKVSTKTICWKHIAIFLNAIALLNSVTLATIYPWLRVEVQVCKCASLAALTGIASTPAAGEISMVEDCGSTRGAAQQGPIGGPCVMASGTLGAPYTVNAFVCGNITNNPLWHNTQMFQHLYVIIFFSYTPSYPRLWQRNLSTTVDIYSPAATTEPPTNSDNVQTSVTHRVPLGHMLVRLTVLLSVTHTCR